MNKQLLLISSSRYQGGEFFAHCSSAIKKFLGTFLDSENVVFIPYALKNYDAYTAKIREAFSKMGYSIISVHEVADPKNLIADNNTKAIFVGGGNTFRLKKMLETNLLVDVIATHVGAGKKYLGSSAGTVMSCPTIKTTNDMPIVMPKSFDALGLVNFQINPHFVPGSLVPNHMGETRETRLAEYHEENDLNVIGLPEGNWIKVNGDEYTLHGTGDAMIFLKGGEKRLWLCGSEYSE